MRTRVLVIAAALWLSAGPAWGQLRDPSFGAGGLVDTFLLGDVTLHDATDVAVQPDGRIVVTGLATCEQMENCFAAARLNPDGSLDPSFGTGGVARHSPVRRTDAVDVAVQPDGRIVLAGEWFRGGDANNDELACLMRLLPDGRLDTSFSRDGVVRFDHGAGDDHLVGVAMQGRRIVAAGAGRFITGLTGGFAVTRLRPDGSRDRSFGRRGRRIVYFGRRRWALPAAVATAPRGRIVVAGIAGTKPDRWNPAVARLTRNGRLDRGFGRGGRVFTRVRPFGGAARALQVDAGGRVLVAGNAYSAPRLDPDASAFALARYSAAGRLEHLLRDDVTTGGDRALGLALAGDRVVAAGTFARTLGVARYVFP